MQGENMGEIAGITAIISLTVLVCWAIRLLKQPLIIGYIISGIIAGPYVLGLVHSSPSLEVFSHIGVALLLFIVGLGLSPRIIRDVGKVSVITGAGQVLFTSIAGFFICRWLGLPVNESIYVAVALTFSSTIIIMKLLSDKGDTETLYGRISIGFLIVQDLIAMLILMAVPSIGSLSSAQGFPVLDAFLGICGIAILLAFGHYALPRLIESVAKSQEFLLLFSIGWCLALASGFSAMGFPMEIGALLAGVTLSTSPYRFEISSKMRLLRDFFLILFFILLGSQLVFSEVQKHISSILVLSAFILLGNPLIVMILMGIMGYTKRTSFLAGLTVAQISEFSLILVALGASLGHISKDMLSLVTVVGLITIGGSTYLIIYGNKFYSALSPFLSVFEKKGRKIDEHKYHEDIRHDVLLFGYNRIGYELLESFGKIRKKVLVVDYNPQTIAMLAKSGIPCRYGDASDIELLSELGLQRAKMVFSTIPEIETSLLLLQEIRKSNKGAVVIAISHQIGEALELYKSGATYVITPHFLGGHYAAKMIERFGLSREKFKKEGLAHIRHLQERRDIGHEHPKREAKA